jgi:hypothetical protein
MTSWQWMNHPRHIWCIWREENENWFLLHCSNLWNVLYCFWFVLGKGLIQISAKYCFFYVPFSIYAFICLFYYKFADLFLLYHIYALTVT